MSAKTMRAAASVARFELEVAIAANRSHVWQLITDRIGDWWVQDLHCLGADSDMQFDPVAGGTLVEKASDGSSLLWFTVIAVEPGSSINLAGSLAPPFGGPCQTYLLLQLTETDAGTTVRMTHSLHGHVDDGMVEQARAGWQQLLVEGIQAAAERAA